MAQSKPYNFYSLNNVPALVSLNNDDYDEEPETDFSEEVECKSYCNPGISR